MNKKMFLNDYNLILPRIPSEEEWANHIGKSEGLERKAILSHQRFFSLLKTVTENKATYERLGWLNVWSKTMMILDSARLAFSHSSDLLLKIIYRSAFEFQLHSMALANQDAFVGNEEELSNNIITLEKSRKFVGNQIRERLRAYTAWCLWSDKVYYEEIADSRTLAGVWNPEPAREMRENEAFRELHKQLFAPLFGPIPIETDEELRGGKNRMREFYREKIELINHWLSDPQLKKYADKIKKIPKDKRSSFFSILDIELSSVANQLRIFEARFAYGEYKLGSMILHGSSMEQFLSIGESFIYPTNFIPNKDEFESYFDAIISCCDHIFFALTLIHIFGLKDKSG